MSWCKCAGILEWRSAWLGKAVLSSTLLLPSLLDLLGVGKVVSAVLFEEGGDLDEVVERVFVPHAKVALEEHGRKGDCFRVVAELCWFHVHRRAFENKSPSGPLRGTIAGGRGECRRFVTRRASATLL